MSKLQTYRHANTGKVGQYSEAVAAFFPELLLVDEAPEFDEPTAELTSIDGSSVAKKKREVAV